MTLINQDIKNLVSGISQQPPILRYPEQLEAQVNGFSTEASGLQKRPPSLHVAKIMQRQGNNKPLIHFIDRDDIEKYMVVFINGGVQVYDLLGNEKEVVYDDDQDYLATDEPRYNLKVVTIADYTFIANITKKVEIPDAPESNVWDTQGLLVNIKSGQYGRTYRIDIDGETKASYETPDGSDKSHTTMIATDYIVGQLATQLEAKQYTVVKGSSWLYIDKAGIASFNIYDGYNNQAAFGILRTTQKFTNLPVSAPDGFTVKIAGEEGSSTDDYYVAYSVEDEVWKETVRPGLINKFKNETMPHALVREADGSFHFKRLEWSPREIGDEDSNPLPSFVDQTINNIFYHRNRLGFLSGENVILTRSADFFNFWMTSAIEVQDTDPIDLAVSDNKIATLYNAVPFDSDLILFSKDAQFSLEASNVLSPKDAYIPPPWTHFGSSLKAEPVNAGRNIYFTAERSQYTTVREYFTAADNTDSKDAQDITSHCPNYIPNGVYKLIPSTIENILLFLTEGDENSIYVYKYLFIDGQRQQAAWSRWDFGAKIYGGVFMDSYLYIVVERNGWLCLEKISFTFNTKDFQEEFYRVLLDRKVLIDVTSASYRSVDDETKIDISAVYGDTYDPAATYSVVMDDGTYLQAENGVVTVPGNYQGTKAVVGINYLFKIVMSTIMVKTNDNGSTIALNEGRLQLRQMWFNYADSGYFKVKVNDYEYINTQRILGTPSATLGEMPFATGTFKFPVQAENTKSVISLESDSPLPLSLVGAGWIGNYVRRSRKY